jgi:hypothetical protein
LGGLGGCGRISKRQHQGSRLGALLRWQPAGETGNRACPLAVGRSLNACPESRIGQQTLVMCGAQYRIACGGEACLSPQRRKVRREIQFPTSGKSRLQRIAFKRVTKAWRIQRLEVRPVVAPCQLDQKMPAQITGGNPVRVSREIGFDDADIDLPDIVFERSGLQIRVQGIVFQANRQPPPAVPTLLRDGIGLLERNALCAHGLSGRRGRGNDQQPEDWKQKANKWCAPWRGTERHGNSWVVPAAV